MGFLQRLDVSYNGIEKSGLHHVAKVVTHCPLVVLDVTGNDEHPEVWSFGREGF
jgi:hypothetical protein